MWATTLASPSTTSIMTSQPRVSPYTVVVRGGLVLYECDSLYFLFLSLSIPSTVYYSTYSVCRAFPIDLLVYLSVSLFLFRTGT